MRKYGILSDLPEHQFRPLSCIMRPGKYRRGQILFIEENPGMAVFSIRSGWVKLTKSLKAGQTQIVGLRGPGEILGLEALFSDCYSVTAELLTDAQICSAQAKVFQDLLVLYPEIALGMIRALNREIESLRVQIRDLGLKTAQKRVSSLLTAAVLPGNGIGNKSLFPLALSRPEMGELLGLAPESVSRVLSQLQAEGLIRLGRREISILKPEKLLSISE